MGVEYSGTRATPRMDLGVAVMEYVEQENWYWHYLARRDFGGVVHRPERLRRIVDNNTAP